MTEQAWEFSHQHLVDMARVEALDIAPDGSWAAVQVARKDREGAAYIHDLWRVEVTTPAAEPTKLTRTEDNDRAPQFAHDQSLLFLSNRATGVEDDEGHDKRAQVWSLRPIGGEAVPLTEEPLGVSRFLAARHAEVIVTLSNRLPDVEEEAQRKTAMDRQKHGPSVRTYKRMPVRYWDHWVPEAAPHLVVYRDGEAIDLTPEGYDRQWRHAVWALSDDGRWLAITRNDPNPDDRMHDATVELWDLQEGTFRDLHSAPRLGVYSVHFTPDARHLVVRQRIRQDGRMGPTELVAIEVASGGARTLHLDKEIEFAPQLISPDGATLYGVADWEATTPIVAVGLEDGAVTRITSAEVGGTHAHLHWVAHTEDLVCLRSTLRHPPRPCVVARRADSRPRMLSDLSGWEASAEEVTITNHHATSSDGEPCQYYVVQPASRADTAAPAPCIVWIHGGPISSWGDVWHWRWNSLVGAAQGYTMVLPNPRGSTGFGQQWIEGIWGNEWGAQCYEDLMAVSDAVATRPDVDAEAMCAMGGSFGGYMTSWIGTQTDRFGCLVTHAGLYDLGAFHGVTDHPAYWTHMFGANPYTERDAFERYSPARHVSDWVSPTLIIHGQRDYRVPVGEALALFEALQFHGVDSELVIYPDENHWILKPRNIVTWYQEVFDFIGRHLGEQL